MASPGGLMQEQQTNGRARLGVRAFLGDQYPGPPVAQLTDGLEVAGCYMLRGKRRLETRQNKPYLRLVLGDRTGEIIGNVWEDAERWEPCCAEQTVVGVRGRAGFFQERLQLRIDEIQPLDPLPEDIERLLPTSPRDRAAMEKQLDELVASISDPAMRALVRRCVGKDGALGRAYRAHPAAKRNHHAYVAGLIEHSLSVALACDRLGAHYREQGFTVDRDLLIAGALLHDLGKLRELEALPASGYTTEGRLLGHIVLGTEMVGREAAAVEGLSAERLLLLQHLIVSHQGRPEWDSPRMPQTVEAMILHYADDLDAKLNIARGLLAGTEPGEWSNYDRALERSLLQSPDRAPALQPEPVPSNETVELLIDLFRT